MASDDLSIEDLSIGFPQGEECAASRSIGTQQRSVKLASSDSRGKWLEMTLRWYRPFARLAIRLDVLV
jgi:hypothetical protein